MEERSYPFGELKKCRKKEAKGRISMLFSQTNHDNSAHKVVRNGNFASVLTNIPKQLSTGNTLRQGLSANFNVRTGLQLTTSVDPETHVFENLLEE